RAALLSRSYERSSGKEEDGMRPLSGVSLAAIALVGGFYAYVQWASCPRAGAVFALEPNETALDEFSRRKRYITVEPWRVAYIDEGSGPPVVLLHGCPFHAFQWRDLIPRLKDRRRVLAPDLLGLGDTQVRLRLGPNPLQPRLARGCTACVRRARTR